MKRAKRCAALFVFVGIIAAGIITAGIVTTGCRSQPQGTAVDEAAGESVAEPSSGGHTTQVAEPSRITPEQLIDVFKDSNVFLLDVRGPEEIEEVGTVEGYTNIPIDQLEARLDELPRDRPILTA